MVAGDSKRVIVIKNISSDIFEEAIFILKSNSGCRGSDKLINSEKSAAQENEFILREAERIINQYIRKNGLAVKQDRLSSKKRRIFRCKLTLNQVINLFLIAAVIFLIFTISRIF